MHVHVNVRLMIQILDKRATRGTRRTSAGASEIVRLGRGVSKNVYMVAARVLASDARTNLAVASLYVRGNECDLKGMWKGWATGLGRNRATVR
jgi:hypothetical protein